MADVTQILTRQHREVDSLFERFDAATTDQERGDITREIIENLSRHSAVEEMTVYPRISDEVGDREAASLRHEHHELKEVLAEIEDLDAGDAQFVAKVHTARRLVREHVQEEEGEVFPRFRKEVSAATLEELGDKIESQWKSAPTHPHPNAPDTPPANKIAGPAAGMADRAKDALRGD